jgi:predicted RNA-binding Zn-ribbon protein involved in translation (DUF1610 family)
MECPVCNEEFNPHDHDVQMGHGDLMCPHCGHVIYSDEEDEL